MRHLVVLLAVAVGLAGCGAGPSPEELHAVVQERLDRDFSAGLFQVTWFRRMGTHRSTDPVSGRDELLVYFDARLRFRRAYSMADWNSLGLDALVRVLGAGAAGVDGIRPEGNQTGDELLVHGTLPFGPTANGFFGPLGRGGAAGASSRGSTAGSVLEAQYDEVRAMVDELGEASLRAFRSGDAAAVERIHSLIRVARNRVARRVDPRGRTEMVVATGHVAGTYYPLGRALAEILTENGLPCRVEQTAGSPENCKMVHHGYADLALCQADVALEARTSGSQFFDGLTLDRLVALCAWYPEAVQVMVPATSEARCVEDLRGRRVVVGLPDSGTRYDADRVLQAAGFSQADMVRVVQEPPAVGLAMLERGDVDAVFLTEASPSRLVRSFPRLRPIRLLPLGDAVVDSLVASGRAFVPLTVPAGAYPNQAGDVRTVAVTALLVAGADMPAERVRRILDLLYGNLPRFIKAHPKGAAISLRHSLDGVSIPQHPAAVSYFEDRGV